MSATSSSRFSSPSALQNFLCVILALHSLAAISPRAEQLQDEQAYSAQEAESETPSLLNFKFSDESFKSFFGSESTVSVEKAVENLLTWLNENGISGLNDEESLIEVDIQYASGIFHGPFKNRPNIGLIARRHVSAHHTLLTIPAHLTVSSRKEESGFLYNEENKDSPLWPHASLATWLLREKARERERGEKSFWKPFIDLFPRKVSWPLTFNQSEIEELQYPPIAEKISMLKAAYAFVYESLNKSNSADADLAQFHWSISAVQSRSIMPTEEMRREGDGENNRAGDEGQILLLVPLLDLIDVDAFPNCHIKMSPNGDVSVVASRDVSSGETLFLPYEQMPNDDFLLKYGFVPRLNPFDNFALFSNATEAGYFFRHSRLSAVGEFDYQHLDEVMTEFELADILIAREIKGSEKYGQLVREGGSRFALSDKSQPYYAWQGQIIDPRLFLAFSLLSFVFKDNAKPNWPEMAKAVLPFAWNILGDKVTCDSVDVWAEEAGTSDAMGFGAESIVTRIDSILGQFPTTYYQDNEELQVLKTCLGHPKPPSLKKIGGLADGSRSVGRSSNKKREETLMGPSNMEPDDDAIYDLATGENEKDMNFRRIMEDFLADMPAHCTEGVMARLGERINILTFRMLKKVILINVKARLVKNCPI